MIKKDIAKELLHVFRELGAFKLTILGGEISLYDVENDYKDLIELLDYANSMGYQYIRIDTNGQCEKKFFRNNIFKYINEASFSLDGYNSEINDEIRGEGSYQKALNNLGYAIINGINVHITSCVTKQNTAKSGGIINYVEEMIEFAEQQKVSQINFHGVFKMGVPMDVWTQDSHLDIELWMEASKVIYERIQSASYKIPVRFPLHIISRREFEKRSEYYGYCPCKLGERALIHPDGIIRVCSSLLSTPYGVANYNEKRICWNDYSNELSDHRPEFTPCTNQKALYSDENCPICFSIKPFQNEPVWQRLNMDEKSAFL